MTEKTIGIIAAPEFSTEIAHQLKEQLPSILSEKVDEDISWKFEIMTDGITSVAEDSETLLNSVLNRQKDKGWDYTLSLTDIPIYFENEVSLARVNFDHNTGFLSLPALGWFVRKRVAKIAVEIIEDLHYKKADGSENEKLDNIFMLNKIRKSQTTEKEEVVIRYLFYPKVNGRLTILSGMTYDNQPWKIMPSLKSVIAIAFGSGAYALIFPTLWQLSYEYSPLRLVALMSLAIVSLTLWITQSHRLWERESFSGNTKYRILYNTTTIITLLIAVSFFYVILFLLFFITAFILVEPDFYAEQLNLSGTPSVLNYLQLAWMTASVGTVTGAVGVGLEDEENVRHTTYGYRQRSRYDVLKKAREEAEKNAD